MKHRQKGRGRLRVIGWLLGSAVGLSLAALAAVYFLAQGGAEPYRWNPPPEPDRVATDAGSFEISVEPALASIDKPVSISVSGLKPNASALVSLQTKDARGVEFTSWAEFTVDGHGRLLLDHTVPERGTYTGKSASALLWSMRASDGSLFHTDQDWLVRPYRLTVVSEGKRAHAELQRQYPFADVTRRAVAGKRWRGELTIPSGDGPFPVVIVLGGWDDGPMPLTSALLSVKGYAALNLGYHGWDGLPEELIEVPVETITEAIEWLSSQPELDPDRLGIWGVSKGAELALVVASIDPRIKSVAAWAPGSEVFAGISFRSARQRSSWSANGRPLPFAPAPVTRETLRVSARLVLRRPTSFRPSYAAALANADENSAIRAENINGEVLLLAGTDDLIWPAAEMARRLARQAGDAGSAAKITMRIYEHAGHSLAFSLWPAGDFTERFLIRGGTPEANHLAGQKAWRETLALFGRL